MDGILLAIFVVGLIIILIFLIYLVDRVNLIERETRAHHVGGAKATNLSAGPYFGMGGRKLWDAMTEHPPSGIDAAEWANVRQRYALALQLHIESATAPTSSPASPPVKCWPSAASLKSTRPSPTPTW
jgi:hypothetical protein